MVLRKKRRSKTIAPATIAYGQAVDPKDGKKKLCVYAQCNYGGQVAGPVWSHTQAAVRRVLATLTGVCDCGRSFHKARQFEGRRVLLPRQTT